MNIRLIYASHPRGEASLDDLTSILTSSRRNNAAMGICGLLSFKKNYFIQLLEGDRQHVSGLYNRIVADERHTDCCLLSYDEIRTREFANWAMGYISRRALSDSVLFSYSSTNAFDPFALTAEQAPALMRELANTTDRLDADGDELYFGEP